MIKNSKTKIFLDSGDPKDTREILALFGFLEGQTTNPSLIAKNPTIQKLKKHRRLTNQDLLNCYKDVIQEIDTLIPGKPISIEVYADINTNKDMMIEQGKEMSTWAKNVHIKVPATKEGLLAAQELSTVGININVTLVFSVEQAWAVALATKNASNSKAFVSPFIGRLDDQNIDGISLIQAISSLYKQNGINHVLILASSIRNSNVFNFLLTYENVDLITAPKNIIIDALTNRHFNLKNFKTERERMEKFNIQNLTLSDDFRKMNLENQLTNDGLIKFAQDWNSLL
jgi:transaldolase